MSEIKKQVSGLMKYSLDEWRAKAKELFGGNARSWKFKCPACGKVSSVQEYIDAGLKPEDAGNAAYQECIGRYTGSSSPKEGEQPCNWSAYGLFGTLGKGVMVVTPEGKEIEVFDFAPVEEAMS